ncbi:MAG: hypothetical protein ACTSWN_08640 [Promethearchaeota archaeon]
MILQIIDWNWFLEAPPLKIIWNFLEIGIFFILLVFGLYYLNYSIKLRKGDNKIIFYFNLGYALFFFFQAINQLVYLADNGL